MHVVSWIITIAILVYLAIIIYRSLPDRTRPAPGTKEAAAAELTAWSMGRSLAWRLRRWFRSRPEIEGEVLVDRESADTYVVAFPVPRGLVEMDVLAPDQPGVTLEFVEFSLEKETLAIPYRTEWIRGKGQLKVRLRVGSPESVDRIRIRFGNLETAHDVHVRFVSRDEPDMALLRRAILAINGNDVPAAREALEKYDAICSRNPVVVLHLAGYQFDSGKPERAEDYALRAIALRRWDHGIHIYRQVRQQNPWHLTDERLAELRARADGWQVNQGAGVVALHCDSNVRLGFNCYARKRRHIALLIRRRAAARKMRHVEVPVESNRGGLLFTAARVVRADGEVVELVEENSFTVGSAPDDNPFIAVNRRRMGIWILPDLERGDVVEYVYDTAQTGPEQMKDWAVFVPANLSGNGLPTLSSSAEFTAPADWNLVFTRRNTDAVAVTDRDEESWLKTTRFESAKIEPRLNRGDPFQASVLDPLVACGLGGRTWEDVPAFPFADVRKTVESVPELPPALAEAVGDTGDVEAALARAFYWIRDHIKYGALASALEIMESPERAEKLVDAGIGDCKDVSFLLAVACRQLGIPYEFVLVSTQHGLVFEDLPADQFDHVILRARIGDEWRYLDAASAYGIFDGTPVAFQGLRGLVDSDPPTLVTLPEDAAERNGQQVRETILDTDDGWLRTRVEVAFTGHVARWVDELLKDESLATRDRLHAAASGLRRVLPDVRVEDFERGRDTSCSDSLHFAVVGRRARTVPLGDLRVGSFAVTIPGLSGFEVNDGEIRDRFVFPFAQDIHYRLAAEPGVRGAIRAVSTAPPLDNGICVSNEEKGEDCLFERRLKLERRTLTGPDLDNLAATVDQVEAVTRVVITLAGTREVSGKRPG